MPITYSFHADSAVLHSKASGVFTIDELLDYLRKVVADPAISPRFVEFVDFKGVFDLKINYSETRPLISIWESYIEKGCLATVVHAPGDVSFGIA